MIPRHKKRISITIPKDIGFEYLVNKAKKYSMGESMDNSHLYIALIIDFLYKVGYLNATGWQNMMKEYYDK